MTPAKGSPFATGVSPVSLVVHPSGKFAYVACYGSDDISGYAIDATTGALRPLPGSPFADMGSAPEGVFVAPDGNFAYVANSQTFHGFPDFIAAYTIDATRGTLTPVTGSPFKDAGAEAVSGAVDTTSKFAYVANDGSSDVSAYTINAADGALKKVKGSPFKTGSVPFGMAVCRVTAGSCVPSPP